MEKKSLLMLVLESQDFATLDLLESKEPGQRIVELEKMFFISLSKGSDEAAKKFGSWVLHATSSFDDLEKQQISKERTEKAIVLWKQIKLLQETFTKKAKEEFYAIPNNKRYDSLESHLSKHVPTFSATKMMLLTDIFDRWRNTDDEAESGSIFKDFLLVEFFQTRPGKEEEDLMRKTVDYFRTNRLVRHIVLTESAKKEIHEDFMRILFVAWARRVREKDAVMKFAILEPLADCSSEAHDLMKVLSMNIRQLDQDVQYLLYVLGVWNAKKPADVEKYDIHFHGTECTVSYTTLGLINVHLQMKAVKGNFKEKEGNDLFERARKNIQLWQTSYQHNICLVTFVKDKYGNEVLFTRQEDHLVK